jgi:DNA-binding MarR family transcriptional regulator
MLGTMSEDARDTREEQIAAWLAFLRAHSRVTDALGHELEAAEAMPMTWFDVLVQLRDAPGNQLRMQELVNRLAMTASGLSRRISRMEQAGLVERRPCPEDRRGVLVVLTREGMRRYRKAVPVHMRGVQRYFLDHLGQGDAEALNSLFSRVLEGLDAPEC